MNDKNFTDNRAILRDKIGLPELCGSHVPVFYNPKTPTESSLDVTLSPVGLAFAVLGASSPFSFGLFMLRQIYVLGFDVPKVIYSLAFAMYYFLCGCLVLALSLLASWNGIKTAAVSVVVGSGMVFAGYLFARPSIVYWLPGERSSAMHTPEEQPLDSNWPWNSGFPSVDALIGVALGLSFVLAKIFLFAGELFVASYAPVGLVEYF